VSLNTLPSWLLWLFDQEAKSGVIELHDDDPIYFEILLRYLYEHKWNTTIADQKSHGRHKDTFPAKALTPIGVYALADKYGVEELMACAVDRLAHPVTPACDYWFAGRVAYLEQSRNVLEAHYSHCVKSNCPMGRRLCQIVIKYGERSAKDKVIEDLAVKSPALAADMYFAARESGSKIWWAGYIAIHLAGNRPTSDAHGMD
jgi:hypothetical protein